MTNSRSIWAPSLHRFGKAFDHSLLQLHWTWRVKAEKHPPMKDYGAMDEAKWCELNNQIHINLKSPIDATYDISTQELQGKPGVDAALDYMTKSIAQAVDQVVPDKKKEELIKRRVSDKTRALYEQRTKLFSAISASGKTVKRSMRNRWNKRIRNANLQDYNDWLDNVAKDMERAYARGDTKSAFNSVHVIGGGTKSFTGKAPTQGDDGEMILDQNALAQLWQKFLTRKFEPTDEDQGRIFTDLGPQLEEDPLTREVFLNALSKLKTGKACGPNGLPAEVFKNCDAASSALFDIMCRMWQLEYVPTNLVCAAFVMLFKNKGTVDDPTKYRCIGLLPHAYKALAIAMLECLTRECKVFLLDWQAGFRAGRGCRDNIFILAKSPDRQGN